MNKLIVTAGLLLFPVLGMSQSISSSSLSWQVSSYKNLQTDTVVSKNSVFESGPSMIRWLQKNGTYVYEFTVTGTQGTWTDTGTIGEFTFLVQFRGYSGSIKFSRTSAGLRIEPDVRKNGLNLFPYAMNCSTLTPN